MRWVVGVVKGAERNVADPRVEGFQAPKLPQKNKPEHHHHRPRLY